MVCGHKHTQHLPNCFCDGATTLVSALLLPPPSPLLGSVKLTSLPGSGDIPLALLGRDFLLEFVRIKLEPRVPVIVWIEVLTLCTLCTLCTLLRTLPW